MAHQFKAYNDMINLLVTFLSLVLLLIGVLSMVTPIPGGTFMIAASISMLICSNAKAQRYMQILRTKYNALNKAIFWLEKKVGNRIKFIGIALEKTRPHTDI